ncbi:MAG: hypothetical protein SGJ11_10410 [Phycisphaerae bacterium]|nr:hypothetical protein [Phycisphaerae bacterium]
MSPVPFPPTGGGALGIFGGMMIPIGIFLMLRRQPPGVVGLLMRAGATSPATALKPSTAKITRSFMLAGPLRSGVVTMLPDGRCWVDVAKVRRRRWITAIALSILAGVAAELVWLFVQWANIV